MAKTPSISNLTSLQNETTAVAAINTNNANIVASIANTLSRDGSSPNAMGSDLDMNSYKILNLPTPATSTDPVRLGDMTTAISSAVTGLKGDRGDTGASYNGTSTSSLTIITSGSISLVTQTGLAYNQASRVNLSSSVGTMTGNVSSYNSTTGNLSVQVDTKTGSGTSSVWAISLAGTSSPGTGPIYDVKTSFGALGDGTTNDATAIQNALNAANAAGGGIVYLPPGVYRCTQGLKVFSNTTLLGSGQGSVIKNDASMASTSMGGVSVTASICLIAVTNAKVARLMLDHSTNSTTANGIQIGEVGASSRSTDCVVEDCYLKGFNSHQYLIYNKLADRTFINNNYIVGHTTTTSTDLAGIEIYGGDDVLVQGNKVYNCGPGITLVQEAISPGSDLRRIRVIGNTIKDCYNGIQVTATATGLVCQQIDIIGNTVIGGANNSIFLQSATGNTLNQVNISGNIIRDATVGLSGQSSTPGTVKNVVFHNNSISCVGTSGGYIYLNDWPEMVISSNSTYGGVPYNGVTIDGSLGASRIQLLNNQFQDSRFDFLVILNGTKHTIRGNNIRDYGQAGTSYGISVASSAGCVIQDNYFENTTAAAPISVISWANVDLRHNSVSWEAANDITLGNGGSGPIDLKGMSIVRITGPSAGFTVEGFNSSSAGTRDVDIINKSGQAMTIATQSVNVVAQSQILTGTGANVVLGVNSRARIRWDNKLLKWQLISYVG